MKSPFEGPLKRVDMSAHQEAGLEASMGSEPITVAEVAREVLTVESLSEMFLDFVGGDMVGMPVQ